ncbi:flavodoxin domain-containing protein [Nocardioides sp.]|uniref:flavodoxin family protein n=1 Tax=Nocardioides sp. TaxID=35761 RepID=UPI002734D192|nr:flavodoxin domain-containing protein [Nocardioides sp.]MDP3894351.1 flavodoxin domain-containing protein [Nocardioides sp.]
MRALVVYESMFGNTEEIARAIGAGLAEQLEVDVISINHAPHTVSAEVSLLLVGGPTHAFSLSRKRTREDAVRQGAHAITESGLREWLDQFQPAGSQLHVRTFDTRVTKVRRLPGSAAAAAARRARRRGLSHVHRGESFYVTGVAGPLDAHEAERATEWGRQVARETVPGLNA